MSGNSSNRRIRSVPFAARYARALFGLATEAGAVEAVSADLDRLGTLLEGEDGQELRRFLDSPARDRATRRRAMEAVLARMETHPLVARFAGVVIANGRAAFLGAMIDAFRDLLDESRGILHVSVRSAQPLTGTDIADIRDRISTATGRTAVISTTVDPGLIGGLVILAGSMMTDASVRGKLDALATMMKRAG